MGQAGALRLAPVYMFAGVVGLPEGALLGLRCKVGTGLSVLLIIASLLLAAETKAVLPADHAILCVTRKSLTSSGCWSSRRSN